MNENALRDELIEKVDKGISKAITEYRETFEILKEHDQPNSIKDDPRRTARLPEEIRREAQGEVAKNSSPQQEDTRQQTTQA